MTFDREEPDIRRSTAGHGEAAVYGASVIDSDSDADSDPETGRHITGLPNKPLDPTPKDGAAERKR